MRNHTAEIEALKLTFGASSESGRKLLDQLELQLAELKESVAEDKASVEMKGAGTSAPDDTPPCKPARRPLPAHLPRERIVHPAPSPCPCCGGALRKLGKDIIETLEHVPAQWKVIQHVREKASARPSSSMPTRSVAAISARTGPDSRRRVARRAI